MCKNLSHYLYGWKPVEIQDAATKEAMLRRDDQVKFDSELWKTCCEQFEAIYGRIEKIANNIGLDGVVPAKLLESNGAKRRLARWYDTPELRCYSKLDHIGYRMCKQLENVFWYCCYYAHEHLEKCSDGDKKDIDQLIEDVFALHLRIDEFACEPC